MSAAPKLAQVTLRLAPEIVTNLDRAIIEERARSGNYIPRNDVIVAIIESVDLPRFVAKMAKDAK